MTSRIVRVLLCAVGATVACDEPPTANDSRPTTEATPWLFLGAREVNDDGMVVGTAFRRVTVLATAETYSEVGVATWTETEGMTVLPRPAGHLFGWATDINSSGEVLAVAFDSVSFVHGPLAIARAVVWDGTDWSVRGDFHPMAIDEDGTVLGFTVEWPSQDRTPVIAAPDGLPSPLTGLAGFETCGSAPSFIAYDIADGRVVGIASTLGVAIDYWEAFVWTESTGAEAIFPSDQCAPPSNAVAVNLAGDVTGISYGLQGAYVARSGGQPVLLEKLPDFEEVFSCAQDISDSGWIAGWISGVSSGTAVRWNPQGDVEDLGEGIALAINDSGLVAGHHSWFTMTYAVVWLPDGSRVDLGGPNGAAGTPDDWDAPFAAPHPAGTDARSMPCDE